VRDVVKDTSKLANYALSFTPFDFTDKSTYKSAFENCDIVFLLRPPQISDVKAYFKPLIDCCKEQKVKHIVFLSVQGVENSKIIPHHKIEKQIVESKIPYTFLRPAYFMQNFTTSLREDLVQHARIFLPAGKAKFTLIDLRDLGEVAARILTNLPQHHNTSYELTSKDKLTFTEMAETLSAATGRRIQFQSPNLIRFFFAKRKENVPVMLILVMIMLHYLPRFQKEPETSDWVEKILGRAALPFTQFAEDNKRLLSE
jgi:uncharacterized protein YbjT (DUF2867 family)